MDQAATLALLSVFCLTMSAFSLVFGTSWLVYGRVSRNGEPIAYWLATAIWSLLAIAGLFAAFVPTCVDPNTLHMNLGACYRR